MWRAASGGGAAGTVAMWHGYGYNRRVVTLLRLRAWPLGWSGWRAGLLGTVLPTGTGAPGQLHRSLRKSRTHEVVTEGERYEPWFEYVLTRWTPGS